MYLTRVPKVKSIQELKEMNDRLNKAYATGVTANFFNELKAIQKEKKYIYDIDFSIDSWIDIEEWKKEPAEWGNPIELHTRVAYWRKFNALHAWFVENIQKGIDKCEPHIVPIEELQKLYESIKVINKQNAKDLLPTQPGFFFGGTDYDEYYWADLEELKHTLAYLISQQQSDTTYIYCSSW